VLHQYRQVSKKPTPQNTYLLFLGPDSLSDPVIRESSERSRWSTKTKASSNNYLISKPKLRSTHSLAALTPFRRSSDTPAVVDRPNSCATLISPRATLKASLPSGTVKKGTKIDSDMKQLLGNLTRYSLLSADH